MRYANLNKLLVALSETVVAGSAWLDYLDAQAVQIGDCRPLQGIGGGTRVTNPSERAGSITVSDFRADVRFASGWHVSNRLQQPS